MGCQSVTGDLRSVVRGASSVSAAAGTAATSAFVCRSGISCMNSAETKARPAVTIPSQNVSAIASESPGGWPRRGSG